MSSLTSFLLLLLAPATALLQNNTQNPIVDTCICPRQDIQDIPIPKQQENPITVQNYNITPADINFTSTFDFESIGINYPIQDNSNTAFTFAICYKKENIYSLNQVFLAPKKEAPKEKLTAWVFAPEFSVLLLVAGIFLADKSQVYRDIRSNLLLHLAIEAQAPTSIQPYCVNEKRYNTFKLFNTHNQYPEPRVKIYKNHCYIPIDYTTLASTDNRLLQNILRRAYVAEKKQSSIDQSSTLLLRNANQPLIHYFIGFCFCKAAHVFKRLYQLPTKDCLDIIEKLSLQKLLEVIPSHKNVYLLFKKDIQKNKKTNEESYVSLENSSTTKSTELYV